MSVRVVRLGTPGLPGEAHGSAPFVVRRAVSRGRMNQRDARTVAN